MRNSVTRTPIRIADAQTLGVLAQNVTSTAGNMRRSCRWWPCVVMVTGPASCAQLPGSSAKLIPRVTWAVARECGSYLCNPSAWLASDHRNSEMIARIAVWGSHEISSSVTGQTKGLAGGLCVGHTRVDSNWIGNKRSVLKNASPRQVCKFKRAFVNSVRTSVLLFEYFCFGTHFFCQEVICVPISDGVVI
jgi:hypothetical protein